MRPRRAVAFVLLLVFLSVLFVEAYASARFSPDTGGPDGGTSDSVPAEIRTGGPCWRRGRSGASACRSWLSSG